MYIYCTEVPSHKERILHVHVCMYRGTDFPFQKTAFSISENLQFHFNMVEKWKFCFPVEIVHTKYWKFRLHRDVCYKYIRGSAEELHGSIFI